MGRRAPFAASVSLFAGLVGVVCGAPLRGAERPATTTPAARKPDALKAEPARIELDGITLVSTASSEVTRLTAEHLRDRLKQYRKFLPPRTEVKSAASGKTTIRLYGTSAAYRAALANYGVYVDNPACYLWEARVILLGFDGAKYDDVLAAAQEKSARLKQEEVKVARMFADEQRDEERRFELQNVAAQLRSDLRQRRNQAFQRDKNIAKRQREEADKKNERLFGEATERLLALADHELFHAYVQSEVYPQADGGLPPWLDEGLAQLVEHAVRRDGASVVDPRSPTLVRSLRLELKRGEPPTAASLTSLNSKHYLLADRRETDDVRRRYLYAWALAQLLVETKRLTPRDGLDRYVVEVQADPETAFARFTKKPAAEFEAEWRAYLKTMGP